MSDATGKEARWRLRLAEMDFEVVHRAGIKHQDANALSHLESSGEDDRPFDDDLPVLFEHTATKSESEDEAFSAEEQVDHLFAKRAADYDEPMALVLDKEEQPGDGAPSSETIDEFLPAQQTDLLGRQQAELIGNPGSAYDVDCNGFLVR